MHQQFDSTPESAAPVRQIWDTSYVKRQDRFSYFREGVCQAYFALSPEKLNDRSIDARFERVEVFQGLISRISVTPHRLVRTKADVAKIPDEFVALRLQSNTPEGPVLLLNFNQIIDVPINFSQLNLLTLIIKRSALTKDVGTKDLNLSNSPLFNALSKCLQLLTRRYPFANLEELNYLVGAATSLLSAGFIKDKDYLQDSCTQHPSARAGVLQLIKEFVKANLHDPSLSTAIVAAQFSVSPRYIQKIFSTDGMTFKAYVTNARLAQINMDLQDSSVSHIPAGDVAFRWGFRDMTTFHRNFKQHFGDTPGQVRARTRDRWPRLSGVEPPK